jgi:hypothetical protein
MSRKSDYHTAYLAKLIPNNPSRKQLAERFHVCGSYHSYSYREWNPIRNRSESMFVRMAQTSPAERSGSPLQPMLPCAECSGPKRSDSPSASKGRILARRTQLSAWLTVRGILSTPMLSANTTSTSPLIHRRGIECQHQHPFGKSRLRNA